ncbi:O-antigen polymerase [Pseudomonas sp. CLCA07]
MIFIPFFVFVLLFVIYQSVNNFRFGVVSYLILIYVASSFCAIILDSFFEYYDSYNVELEPVLIFTFALSLVFLGFFRFRDRDFCCIELSNFKFLRVLEFSLIPLSLSALVFFTVSAVSALTGDIDANRILISAGDISSLGQFGVINSIFSLVANLFLLNIVFAFLNLSEGYPGRRSIALLHLVSSTAYIFYILSYAGRDGVVFWIMSLVFLFLLFRGFMNRENKKIILIGALLMIIPALIVFMQISVSRFGGDGSAALLFALFDYAGQQVFNFNAHYMIDPPAMHGAISFEPVVELKSWIFGDVFTPLDHKVWFQYFLDRGVIPWVFPTFIGSFLHDFGKLGMLLAAFFMFLLARVTLLCIKRTKTFPFSNFLLFILVFQIVSWGVFYYRQYSAFYYLVAMFLLFMVFKFSGGAKSVHIYKVEG